MLPRANLDIVLAQISKGKQKNTVSFIVKYM